MAVPLQEELLDASGMAQIAIIGGTGLNDLESLVLKEAISVDTPFGQPSGQLQRGELAGCDVLFLARHGQPHKLAPHQINYRANIYALQQQGVKHIFAVNAVGGISLSMLAAGHICIPDQIIDYSWGREHTFAQYHPDQSLLGIQHIDFTCPFEGSARNALVEAAASVGIDVSNGGVYGCSQGPRLETGAEVHKLARDGCDVVGMTAMPEAALARELSIDYAAVNLVVNPAAGLGNDESITLESMFKVVETGMSKVSRILEHSVTLL